MRVDAPQTDTQARPQRLYVRHGMNTPVINQLIITGDHAASLYITI